MRISEIKQPPSIESLIACFGRRSGGFVLDSAQSNDGLGDWSFFGSDPFEVVSPNATGEDGLDMLRRVMGRWSIGMEGVLPFVGGAVGYLSYDYGRRIERLPDLAKDDRDIPVMHFGLYDGIAAWHHRTGRLYLLALGIRGPERAVMAELEGIVAEARGAGDFPGPTAMRRGAWAWNLSPTEYRRAVDRIRQYIASGDVYQVNLSRRARCRFEGNGLHLYQALRVGNPAPYGAYLKVGDFSVLSTSPEQFLRKSGRVIETRPIKGTRARGNTPAEDAIETEALRLSEKDRAELLMIVDLERNDLGRVAEFGSVEVEDLYHIEHYARVIHQTARVRARLAVGLDVFDAIRSMFPGGSITGAPKIRAMEIIEALEPTRRGVYCGSVGYIGFDGNAELNIAIRTLHLKDGYLDYQVGGGIVWDSEAEAEYRETSDKGRAICETIDRVCQKSL